MMSDACEIHFLDMVKFRRKRERNLETPLDRWLLYFDERSPEGLIEEIVKMDSAIRLVQEKMDLIIRGPELLRSYEKAERDYISGINAARRESRQEEKWEIARNLKTMAIPVEQIIQGTGLTKEQIEGL